MAEYTALASQEVSPMGVVAFTDAPVPCTRGYVRHRDGSGSFLLSGGNSGYYYGCPCMQQRNSVNFLVSYGANIAIPTTGTAGEISLGLALDGTLVPTSVVRVTPTATGAFFDVDKTINIPIWRGCCQSVSLVNTSDQAIEVKEANILFSRSQ